MLSPDGGPMVRIHFPPAEKSANFRSRSDQAPHVHAIFGSFFSPDGMFEISQLLFRKCQQTFPGFWVAGGQISSLRATQHNTCDHVLEASIHWSFG